MLHDFWTAVGTYTMMMVGLLSAQTSDMYDMNWSHRQGFCAFTKQVQYCYCVQAISSGHVHTSLARQTPQAPGTGHIVGKTGSVCC